MPNMDGSSFQRALKADALGVLRKGSVDPDALLDLVARACPSALPSH